MESPKKKRPPTPATPVDPELYNADIAVLERYQGFSAEVLRLALLAIAAIGFFMEKLAAQMASSPARWLSAISVVLCCVSVAAALGHRYYSSDGIHYHVVSARRSSAAGKVAAATDRNLLYERSGRFMAVAVITFGLGAGFLGAAFIALLARLG